MPPAPVLGRSTCQSTGARRHSQQRDQDDGGCAAVRYWFCEIERLSLPEKRQQAEEVLRPVAFPDTVVQSTSNLRTLILCLDPDDGGGQGVGRRVDALLEPVGPNLHASDLRECNMDDELLETCLQKCPRLQSLRFECCQLTSLDPLVRSYERGGQIASVDLLALEVAPSFLPRFEAFLSAFLTPSALKRTLKRLRISHQWRRLFCPSSAHVMQQLLNGPLTLEYLHLHSPDHSTAAPPIDWDIRRYHGEAIPVAGAPSLAIRVAFASVLLHFQTQPQFARLDNNAMTSVFEFVGQRKRRIVSVEDSIHRNYVPLSDDEDETQ